MIIVDATSDWVKAREIESVCRAHGAKYVRVSPTVRDTRAMQRNLGVRLAETDWVLIQDDDDKILIEFDHRVFDQSANGVDYVWDGRGNHLLFHRRLNYLRLGGYPEDMVNAEDIVFSRLVRATSRGRLEGSVYKRIEAGKEAFEVRRGSVTRVANLFWYPFTLLRFLERSTPQERIPIFVSVIMMPIMAARRELHPTSLLITVPTVILAIISGFAWHYIRKKFDREFRHNIDLYKRLRIGGDEQSSSVRG